LKKAPVCRPRYQRETYDKAAPENASRAGR